jgi:hypothetical protein
LGAEVDLHDGLVATCAWFAELLVTKEQRAAGPD